MSMNTSDSAADLGLMQLGEKISLPAEVKGPRITWKHALGTSLDVLIVLFLFLAHMALAMYLGLRGFDSFDMSIPADGGWRIYCGQIPYHDFHMPIGPMLFYLQALFFYIAGGFSWYALAWHVGVVGGLAVSIHYGMLRPYCNRLEAILFTGFFFFSYYLYSALPWYDQTAYFFGLTAFALMLVTRPACFSNRSSVPWGASLVSGVLLALAVLSKHNIGIAMSAIVIFFEGWRWHQNESTLKRFGLAGTCACGLVVTLAGALVYFQWNGTILQDLGTSSAQLERFRIALQRIPTELSLTSVPYTLDLWVLLAAGAAFLIFWLSATSISLRMRGFAFVAFALIALNLVCRETSGPRPQSFYYPLVPAGLALFYIVCKGIELPFLGLSVNIRRLAWMTLVPAVLLVLGAAAALLKANDAVEGRILVLGRWSAAYLACSAIMFGLGCWHILWAIRLPSRTAGDVLSIDFPAIIRWSLVVVALIFTGIMTVVDETRREWRHVSEFHGPQAYFTKIPMLKGVRSNREYLRDFEEVYVALKPRLDAEKSLRSGQDLYVFPSDQQLYGILGFESFKGVRLWVHHGLTYKGTDPDTAVLRATRPKYVVLARMNPERVTVDWAPRSTAYVNIPHNKEDFPAFYDLLANDYTSLFELTGFRVLQLKQ